MFAIATCMKEKHNIVKYRSFKCKSKMECGSLIHEESFLEVPLKFWSFKFKFLAAASSVVCVVFLHVDVRLRMHSSSPELMNCYLLHMYASVQCACILS
jgi:hypothetical protein